MDHPDLISQIAELDGLVNHPARLMIVCLLARQDSCEYPRLMERTGLSSGNITTHLQKLAQAGYIRQTKSFSRNKPRTTLSLTDAGRRAYADWGWRIAAALPDEVRDSLRRQVVHNLQPPKQRWTLTWDLGPESATASHRADWGGKILPPLPGTFL